jgi:hypothetical protein
MFLREETAVSVQLGKPESQSKTTSFLFYKRNMYLIYVMDVNVIYTSSISRNNISLPSAFAFDLDETIGSFSDLHSIWARLEPSMKTQSNFSEIMDLYPEFLRVGILSILTYIKGKQDNGKCLPIFIYTNNQCEDISWIYKLITYLERKVSPENPTNIFARPILAFEINGRRVEPNRTTHEKTYSDFVKCSMLSTSHDVCFIDDAYHSKMKHRRVYYIQPPPYIHTLPYKDVVNRFMNSDIYKKIYPNRRPPVSKPTSISEYQKDKLIEKEEQKVTKKIMFLIREFFLISSRRRISRKRHSKIGNFSRKKRTPTNQTEFLL